MRLTTKKITLMAMLTALLVTMQYVLAPFPNIKPLTAILMLLVLFLGRTEAVVVSILTILLNGLLNGFGIWILGQIIGYVVILYLFSWLSRLSQSTLIQSIFVTLLPFLYGLINTIFMLGLFGHQTFIALWLAGLPFDGVHALSTLCFFILLKPIFQKLPFFQGNSIQ
ncbi:ECF transporter S component [Weissella diestrammenae]|uniref:ECF transporter S component n=1 Tax=Weissella diestrammenae TaxID=1162633 RepID=A0A7G9T3M6_9LACO|nr:ECF transporter S component [Weissella diestrammenae]MCM0582678.1 ECF transporter S component [Weissella diestrammenae]QNN74701.1 ECF transporter S component [Weissella diestrammenae]